MNFTEFQATGRDVADLRVIESIADGFDGCDKAMAGRLYHGDLYIESNADGSFFLTVGSVSHASSTGGLTLEALERELYEFAISEGYIEGPSTEQELIDALQGLMNYVGGWDSPAGHPCRVAADLLARLT